MGVHWNKWSSHGHALEHLEWATIGTFGVVMGVHWNIWSSHGRALEQME